MASGAEKHVIRNPCLLLSFEHVSGLGDKEGDIRKGRDMNEKDLWECQQPLS